MPALDLFRLDGRVALVTGAGAGIGQSFAVALAEAGADVAAVDRDAERVQETADLVRRTGRRAVALAADVTREADAAAMVAATLAELGGVDVAFANAGVSEQSTPLLDATLEEWQRVIDVDLTGVFLTVREAARVMVPRGRGKIVSTASIYGFVGSFLGGQGRAYAAAKAGVVNFTRSVAIELAPYNVQVNAIAPTFTRTGLGRGLLLGNTDEGRALIARIEERTPMGRLAQPDDLRGAAIFLASAASDLVTGHTVVVDGGWLAW